jgi:hypothetical protein
MLVYASWSARDAGGALEGTPLKFCSSLTETDKHSKRREEDCRLFRAVWARLVVIRGD